MELISGRCLQKLSIIFSYVTVLKYRMCKYLLVASQPEVYVVSKEGTRPTTVTFYEDGSNEVFMAWAEGVELLTQTQWPRFTLKNQNIDDLNSEYYKYGNTGKPDVPSKPFNKNHKLLE